jgi:hypothetical protein
MTGSLSATVPTPVWVLGTPAAEELRNDENFFSRQSTAEINVCKACELD